MLIHSSHNHALRNHANVPVVALTNGAEDFQIEGITREVGPTGVDLDSYPRRH